MTRSTVVGADHIAGIDLPRKPTRPINGSGDAAIGQLKLRVVDLALIGFDDAFRLTDDGFLSIQLLLWNKALFVESSRRS